MAASATSAEAPKAKRTRKSGPRKAADVHVFARITDAQGQHIPGAKLDIAHQTKDAKSALKFLDSNSGNGYQRFVIPGATGAAADTAE